MPYPRPDPDLRPTALTAEVQAAILEAVRAGNYFSVACTGAGISRQAVDYWRRLWAEGDRRARRFADFFAALEKANAEAEVASLKTVRSGQLGWQGSAWFLERRFRSRWARKDQAAPVAEATVDLHAALA